MLNSKSYWFEVTSPLHIIPNLRAVYDNLKIYSVIFAADALNIAESFVQKSGENSLVSSSISKVFSAPYLVMKMRLIYNC